MRLYDSHKCTPLVKASPGSRFSSSWSPPKAYLPMAVQAHALSDCIKGAGPETVTLKPRKDTSSSSEGIALGPAAAKSSVLFESMSMDSRTACSDARESFSDQFHLGIQPIQRFRFDRTGNHEELGWNDELSRMSSSTLSSHATLLTHHTNDAIQVAGTHPPKDTLSRYRRVDRIHPTEQHEPDDLVECDNCHVEPTESQSKVFLSPSSSRSERSTSNKSRASLAEKIHSNTKGYHQSMEFPCPTLTATESSSDDSSEWHEFSPKDVDRNPFHRSPLGRGQHSPFTPIDNVPRSTSSDRLYVPTPHRSTGTCALASIKLSPSCASKDTEPIGHASPSLRRQTHRSKHLAAESTRIPCEPSPNRSSSGPSSIATFRACNSSTMVEPPQSSRALGRTAKPTYCFYTSMLINGCSFEKVKRVMENDHIDPDIIDLVTAAFEGKRV